ncbi:hypothetical protein PT2222_70273 [Paraburkholderia tropica]
MRKADRIDESYRRIFFRDRSFAASFSWSFSGIFDGCWLCCGAEKLLGVDRWGDSTAVVRECRIAQVGRGAKAELNLGSPQMPQKARAAAVRPNRVVPPNTHATADFTNASRDGQFINVEWSEADLSEAVWQDGRRCASRSSGRCR